jgi:biopolymer transport protein ExbD
VTVLDYTNGTQAVLSVQSQHQSTTTSQSVIIAVDQYGNNITRTNDIKYIQTIPEVTASVVVIQQQQNITNWTVASASTTDYGTVTQVTLTITSSDQQNTIQTTTLYDQKSNQTTFVSAQPVQSGQTGSSG